MSETGQIRQHATDAARRGDAQHEAELDAAKRFGQGRWRSAWRRAYRSELERQPTPGDRRTMVCHATGQATLMEFIEPGYDGEANGRPGWLCLHDDERMGG